MSATPRKPVSGAQSSPGSDEYAGLSPTAAQRMFEQRAVRLRIQQRAAQLDAIAALEKLASQAHVDALSRTRLNYLAARLAETSDFSMAVETVLQVRSQLHEEVREAFDAISLKLTDQLLAYRQCKLDYQPIAGKALAERWPQLSLEEKRIQIADYLALADQRPVWLLRKSPIGLDTLVPKSVMPAIRQ